MFRSGAQAIVKLGPHRTDRACLVRHLVLPPDLRDGARDRDEIGGRREQHLVAEGEVPQFGIVFERSGDEMLAGDEHDDIVGRVVELTLVAF